MSQPKWKLTGRTRLCLVTRWFRRPLVGLEAEWENTTYYNDSNRPREWESAKLESLTKLSGLDHRTPSTTIRYRAHKQGLFNTLWLVLQVCDDPDTGKWRDARVEDLGNVAAQGVQTF